MSNAARSISRVARLAASLALVGFGVAKLAAAREVGALLAAVGVVEITLGLWLFRSKGSARSVVSVLLWAVVALIAGEAAEADGGCHCLGELVTLAPRARRLILLAIMDLVVLSSSAASPKSPSTLSA